MKRDTNCPICSKVCVETWSAEDNCGVTESYFSCEPCQYSEEYAYGFTRAYIGNNEFQWGYKNDKDDQKQRLEWSDMILKRIKELNANIQNKS